MKIKTYELTDVALDWVVAICEGLEPFTDGIAWIVDVNDTYKRLFSYSTNWAQGGPIIERENISVMFSFDLQIWVSAIGELWVPEEGGVHGPTPLVAAMRCYVASKLGDEVDIPEEIAS